MPQKSNTTIPTATDPLDREFAPGWRPELGEKIRGRVVELDLASRDADYGGGQYPVVTLELLEGYTANTKDGTTADQLGVHLIHSALRGKIAALEPRGGDLLAIKFIGEPLGSARGKRYKVLREGSGSGAVAPFDWAPFKFADEQDAPAESASVHAPLEADEAAAVAAVAEQDELDELDVAASEEAEDVPF